MANTYSPALPTELDHVRFLIGDVAIPWVTSDEEIAGVIALHATGDGRPYLAAADLIESLSMRSFVKGGMVEERDVNKLRLKWGNGNQIKELVKRLRVEGGRRGCGRLFLEVL